MAGCYDLKDNDTTLYNLTFYTILQPTAKDTNIRKGSSQTFGIVDRLLFPGHCLLH